MLDMALAKVAELRGYKMNWGSCGDWKKMSCAANCRAATSSTTASVPQTSLSAWGKSLRSWVFEMISINKAL
jgi:hypothetical protein